MPNGMVGLINPSNCSFSSSSNNSSSSSSSLTPLTPVTPDCLKDNNNRQLLGSVDVPDNSPASLTVLNSVNGNGVLSQPTSMTNGLGSIPPAGGPSINQMPLHPAGVIPGPGGDLNGHMNSSNISPSGGAGAPTHLSALSG